MDEETAEWVIFWAWMILNPTIAVVGTVYCLHLFWPCIISALVRIIPMSIGMMVITAYLEGKIFNPSGSFDDGASLFIWGFACGIPYGLVMVLSIIALVAMTSYMGFCVWLKP